MSEYTTKVDGFPTAINYDPDRGYVLDVAVDGHEHVVITDRADGLPGSSVWSLLAKVPSGWFTVATGRHDDPQSAVRAAQWFRQSDDLEAIATNAACRLCGHDWTVVGHEPDEFDECSHCGEGDLTADGPTPY